MLALAHTDYHSQLRAAVPQHGLELFVELTERATAQCWRWQESSHTVAPREKYLLRQNLLGHLLVDSEGIANRCPLHAVKRLCYQFGRIGMGLL